MKMITPAQLRRTAEKTKIDDESLIVCALNTEIREADGADPESRTLDFTISNDTVDSYRDVISADGWVLDRYLKNPVVLWAHSHWSPPVARASNVRVEGESLKASAEFASREINTFSDDVFKMIKAGFLKATSVGFIPLEWTWDDTRGGFNFLKQELFEFSIVPVPANPDTLINAIANGRAPDVDLAFLKDWCEQTLDMWRPDGHVAMWVPRHAVEEVHSAITAHAVSVTSTGGSGDVVRTTLTGVSPTGATEMTITDDPYFEFWSINAGFRSGDQNAGHAVVVDSRDDGGILEAIENLRKEIKALDEKIDHQAAPKEDEKGIEAPDDGVFDILGALADGEDDQDDLVAALKAAVEGIINPRDAGADEIDPEFLRSVISGEAERAILKRTGKLPKEV